MNHKTNVSRRVKCLALALAMLLSCCVLPGSTARAAEKTLTSGSRDMILWHKGLPPRDGKWYRVILSNGTRFLRGNSVKQLDDYQLTMELLLNTTYRWRVVGKHNWNHYDQGHFVDMPLEETLLSANDLDLTMDTFYTADYMNTPALRFNSKGGTGGSGYEPMRGGAPTYDIRLCDWSEGDGTLTDETLFSAPYSGSVFGEIFGEIINIASALPDKVGHSIAELFGDNLRTMVVVNSTEATTPWAFIGHENDDEVDEGKYVVSIKADHKSGVYHDVYLEYPNAIFTCVFGLYGSWVGSQEYTVYWGETIHVDSIGADEVIGNGTVVNLNTTGDAKNFLRIAPGVTLTVADGGILSVGAGVFNDGTIKVNKGGTLIVKKNALVMPEETEKKTGNIICDGGDLIVLSGARVVLEGPKGLDMKNGTLENHGVIITRAGMLTDCIVNNRGALYRESWVRSASRGAFMDWTPQISADGGTDWPGKAGSGSLLAQVMGWEGYTRAFSPGSVWNGNYVGTGG